MLLVLLDLYQSSWLLSPADTRESAQLRSNTERRATTLVLFLPTRLDTLAAVVHSVFFLSTRRDTLVAVYTRSFHVDSPGHSSSGFTFVLFLSTCRDPPVAALRSLFSCRISWTLYYRLSPVIALCRHATLNCMNLREEDILSRNIWKFSLYQWYQLI